MLSYPKCIMIPTKARSYLSIEIKITNKNKKTSSTRLEF